MARRRDDDYDDDDDRGREAKSSGGMPKWPFFVLGGLLLVVLICGGVAFGIYYVVYRAVSGVVAAAKSMIPAPPGTYDATDEEITAQLNELKGPTKIFALQHITGYKPKPDRRKEVCQALEPLLNSKDPGVPAQAAAALGIWGTEENVPALHKALQSQDIGFRGEAIKALGEIKSASSAGPLTARLSDVFDRQAATEALKKIGPKAESEVVKYLANAQNDASGRQEACNILGEIGTKNGGSIPALQKAAKDQNFIVANAANTAITSINNSRR